MNIKNISLSLLCILFTTALIPDKTSAQQEPRRSIHQIEFEYKSEQQYHPEKQSENKMLTPSAFILKKKVFGYHPLWASSDEHLKYDYEALSTLGYFSFEIDLQTGRIFNTNDWETSPVPDYVHQQGVKIVPVITNFGYDNNDLFLSDINLQQTFLDDLIELLELRDADGVNIDFESIRGTQKQNFVDFMNRLKTKVKAYKADAEISIAMPAVDWQNAFDYDLLAEASDYLIIMGYDYYWSGSTAAGAVAPLEGGNYNIKKTVESYFAQKVPPEKLLLGVPWYGYDWPVESSEKHAKTTGKGKAYVYQSMEDRAANNDKQFDNTAKVPWFSYMDGSQWRQAWYDDSLSLAIKYQYVNDVDIGGIGIWAISYQGRTDKLWQGIKQAFAEKLYITENATDDSGETIILREATLEIISETLISDVRLFDLAGNVLKRQDAEITELIWEIEYLAPSVYILQYSRNNQIILKKILKY